MPMTKEQAQKMKGVKISARDILNVIKEAEDDPGFSPTSSWIGDLENCMSSLLANINELEEAVGIYWK